MTAFDKYSLLDPAKFAREVATENADLVLDKYALLDQQRASTMIENVLGNDIVIPPAAMLDPVLFQSLVQQGLSAAEEEEEEDNWVLEGALVDFDFENERYFMESERPVSDIVDGVLTIVADGADFRRSLEYIGTTSRPIGTAALIALMQANLATGFTTYMEWTDETDDDDNVSQEFFGLYDIADPEAADNGDAIEFWIKSSGSTLAIDDWVTGQYPTTLNAKLSNPQRNKATVTLNASEGGGNYRTSVCLNGGTPDEKIVEFNYATDHFDNDVLAVSIGWISATDSSIRGIIHRYTILAPISNAEMQTLTAA